MRSASIVLKARPPLNQPVHDMITTTQHGHRPTMRVPLVGATGRCRPNQLMAALRPDSITICARPETFWAGPFTAKRGARYRTLKTRCRRIARNSREANAAARRLVDDGRAILGGLQLQWSQ